MVSIKQRVADLELLHGGLRAAASACGIDASYLQRLKTGEKKNPSDAVLSKLGLERRIIYVLK